MMRVAVACVIACIPLSVRADDPKPDVQKLKDEVELLEAKLDVWKAKVAGAEKNAKATADLLDKLSQAQLAVAAVSPELEQVIQSNIQFTTDLQCRGPR